MRHQKHSNQLGVKKEHRAALMANLAAALIKEGRIETTLKKAKALRPFAERLVTLAKKGGLANRRLAMARVRNEDAVALLFNERVSEFTKRNGGYTRIYKLGNQRRGDAAEMALIEWVGGDDQGYRSTRKRGKGKAAPAAEADKKASTESKAQEKEQKAEAAAAEPEAKAEAEASPEQEKKGE
jgi:large subunit ribosomal protein L17